MFFCAPFPNKQTLLYFGKLKHVGACCWLVGWIICGQHPQCWQQPNNWQSRGRLLICALTFVCWWRRGGGGRALTATLGHPGRGSLAASQSASLTSGEPSSTWDLSLFVRSYPCVSGLLTYCHPWVVHPSKCVHVKVLRRMFFAWKMNRGGPCRVAAEASSAALPSCCQLPAASCLDASWHIRVWQGGASVRSTATVPWAATARRPIFSGSCSYSTVVCVNSFSGQLGSNSLLYGQWPVEWRQRQGDKCPCTLPPSMLPPRYPDNPGVAAPRSNKSPAGTGRLFLHRRHIFHWARVNRHCGGRQPIMVNI